jgi:hypothetical protein
MEKRGRPIGKIKAKHSSVRSFFKQADKLGLSLRDVARILEAVVETPPSYRTIQEWRRGTHTPRHVPFGEWEKILERDHKKKK